MILVASVVNLFDGDTAACMVINGSEYVSLTLESNLHGHVED